MAGQTLILSKKGLTANLFKKMLDHKLFQKKFDHNPFQKRLDRKLLRKVRSKTEKRRDGVINRRNCCGSTVVFDQKPPTLFKK
jgi:hypothetical protein